MAERLLLVSANRETSPYPVFPIGVWVLAQYLQRLGIEVEVADLLQLGGWEGLEPILAARPPDRIGVSVRNVDNLSWPDTVSYLPELDRGMARLKQAVPAERIAVGGAGYSIFGEALRQRWGLGKGIAGEGEAALAGWMRPGRSSAWPEPDGGFAEAVPAEMLRRYDATSGMIGIQTRRGCAFDCSYCTYPQIEGRRLRTRPVARVIDELRAVQALGGVKAVYFVDCNFNVPAPYTLELLDALAEAALGLRWYAFVHPAYFDAAMAERMKRAGCGGVEFGSESGDPLMLRVYRKDMTPEQILAASAACRAVGLKFCHYLLLGAPGETRDSVAASLDLMERCEPSTVLLSTGLRVYPGTGIARQLTDQGVLSPGDPLLEPWFYRPEAIDLPGILAYCRDRAPKHWILSGVHDEAMEKKMAFLRARGLRGPLWDYL